VLTEEQIKKYKDAGGVICPYCGGDIEGVHAPDVDGGTASQEVHCIACGKTWWDKYVWVGIKEVD
jgi:uncharacterized protein with PIN domain